MDPLDRQILILDDESAFAESARSVLRQVATRVRVSAGIDALAAARATRWDLIVCAIELKPHSGPELKKLLGQDPQLAGVPFLFVGRVVEGPGIPIGADAPLRKPVDPELLTQRARRILMPTGTFNAVTTPRLNSGQWVAVARGDRSAPAMAPSANSGPLPRPEAPGQLSGTLDTVAISDVMQMLETSRATGTLAVHGVALAGQMVLREGRVMVARTNHRSGEDAALRLTWLAEGRFQFDKHDVEAPEGPGWTIGRLLMDAAWLHDELTRLGERAPALSDRVEIIDQLGAVSAFPTSAAWKSMVQSRRGLMVVEDLAAELGVSTYRCRALLGKAAEQGWVRILPGAVTATRGA